MGLDMYAYRYGGRLEKTYGVELEEEIHNQMKADIGNDLQDFEVSYGEEIMYWRKHPNLQGLMAQIWSERSGGDPGGFNLIPILLTPEDINQIEKAVLEGALPETNGFFFGSGADDHYKQQDIEFIRLAREAHAEGESVIYNCWW